MDKIKLDTIEEAIEDFRKIGEKDPLFSQLADACDRHKGLWNKEAEVILLKQFGV